MLEARGLVFRYGRTEALRGLDVTLPAGKIVGLVGPNGAGKTTLLHLAVGLLTPGAGELDVLGWSPRKHLTLVLSRVGFVAQDRPLYRDFSVADTLAMGRHLNPRWDDAVARRRLERLEIPLERPVRTLSGGQQAQVALALAVGKRPELLLLDEPVASLDPLARRQFLGELMDAVVEHGMSVVLSSHLVNELERVCDYLVILSKGELQLAGEVDALLRQHAVVAANGVPARVPSGADAVSVTRVGSSSSTVIRWKDAAHDANGSEPVDLEELVLAYLSAPDARALPRPDAVEAPA